MGDKRLRHGESGYETKIDHETGFKDLMSCGPWF